MNTELTYRRPVMADAEQVLALMIRCDIAEYGSADSDMEDLTYDWGEIDLSSDAWLAETGAGDVVGYAAVLPWGDDLRLDFHAEPDWPDGRLSSELLARCFTRAREVATGRAGGLVVRLFVAHSNQRDLAIAREAGFEPGRYFFQMSIDLDTQPPAASWPDGITTRYAVPDQDDRQLHQLIQEAFHQPGRTPQPFESWRDFMMRPDLFDPELWFLARAGEEIIGACLAFAYPTGGWVRQLAVSERWRRQGIGKALLRTAFAAFYDRGFSDVGLTVESKRPDAHSFYKGVGMHQVRQYDEFVLAIG